jgi:hypothetical protein
MGSPPLTDTQIQAFMDDGFVRLNHAFSPDTAAAGRSILWREIGYDPDDPRTWKDPVVRLGGYSQAPFREAGNTQPLRSAFDQLVGPGRWLPLQGLGTFPVRFPSEEDPGTPGGM